MSRRIVRVTQNFHRNLEDIRQFLESQGASGAFSALLEHLFDTVVPNLERFPEMGRDFLARHPQSADGLARLESLTKRVGTKAGIREYIFGDYLILYALGKAGIHLLSIKHHRQLSFDLKGHWTQR